MELPAPLGSFNVAEASEDLKCCLWIDRNLKANWRAKLLMPMDVSSRAEASEGLVSFSHISVDAVSLMLEEFARRETQIKHNVC
jgi:hypothetical protein